MKRRPLLHAVAAGAVLVGGCIGDPAGDDRATTTRTVTDGGRSLSVANVETFAYALRLNDLGTSPHGPVPAVADLDDRERRVVEAAIAEGYETDDPPAWLRKFAGGTPFVQADGAFHRLDHTLPTYTVTAEAASESEVDGAIADREAYREAVTHDGRVTSGLLRVARREGYRLTYVWPSLRAFLDEYDAVRYRGDLLAVSLDVDDPGPPYEVTAEPASLSEVANGPVWDASDAPADVREVLAEATATEGIYPTHDLPDGLLGKLDANDYVHLDGRFYTTYVENREPLPVTLSARFEDGTLDDGATLRLALRNDADGPIQVMSGAPRPFGVLRFHPVSEAEPRRLLWTDAYEESSHVHTDGRQVKMVNSVGLNTAVAPGGEAARTFTVGDADLPAGEYVVEDDVHVDLSGEDSRTLPYRVTFVVP